MYTFWQSTQCPSSPVQTGWVPDNGSILSMSIWMHSDGSEFKLLALLWYTTDSMTAYSGTVGTLGIMLSLGHVGTFMSTWWLCQEKIPLRRVNVCKTSSLLWHYVILLIEMTPWPPAVYVLQGAGRDSDVVMLSVLRPVSQIAQTCHENTDSVQWLLYSYLTFSIRRGRSGLSRIGISWNMQTAVNGKSGEAYYYCRWKPATDTIFTSIENHETFW